MKLFHVAKPGFFTTVQDLGRRGFLKFGVPFSGAMDEYSLQIANMLVRNAANDACLEITVLGPELEALDDTQMAITGGDISPRINGHEAEMWRTLGIRKGDVVSFEKLRTGCRSYLSVKGGVNVPIVLGSRSTYTRCQIGGVKGLQLKAGDVVEGFDSTAHLDLKLSLPASLIPRFQSEAHVNVVLGPQKDRFTEEGVNTFLSRSYTISLKADRMGYRLEGPVIELKTHGDIISDAVLPGAVQVPSDGKPIITMKDAQTTGGYAKIGVILTSDLSVLGQAKPNDTVHFHEVSLSEAHAKLCEFMESLHIIESKLISVDA